MLPINLHQFPYFLDQPLLLFKYIYGTYVQYIFLTL